MKILKYLSFFVAAAVALSSCQKDPKDVFSTDAVAPVMNANEVVLLTEDTFQEDVTYSWSPARNFGDVNYTLYMSFDAKELKLIETAELTYSINKEAFHTLLNENFTLPSNDNYSIDLYVVAANTNGETLKSDPISSLIFVSGELVAPVLKAGADAGANIVLSIDEVKDLALLEWEPARFGYNIAISYEVALTYVGEEDAEPVKYDGITDTKFALNSAELNSMLRAAGYVDAPAELSFALRAYYTYEVPAEGEPAEGEEAKPVVKVIEAKAEDTVTVKVTTYEPKTSELALGAGVPAEGLALNLDVKDAVELLTWGPANLGEGLELSYEVLAKVVGSDKEAFVVDGTIKTQKEFAEDDKAAAEEDKDADKEEDKDATEGEENTPATFEESAPEAVVYAIRVLHDAFNSQLLANGAKAQEPCEVEFYVRAKSGNVEAVSEAVKANVTPCRPLYPEFIYVVGDFCGLNWGNTADLSPILKADSTKPGMYSGVVTFEGATYGAKLYYINAKNEQVWLGGETSDVESPYTYVLGDANITFGNEPGVKDETNEGDSYILIVDLVNNLMIAHKVETVGLIGNGDWNNQNNFTYNPETYSYELKNVSVTSAFKVRMNDGWGDWHNGTLSDPGYNLGGAIEDMTYNGSDITLDAGAYDFSICFADNTNFALSNKLVGEAVEPEVEVYGLVGTANNWGNPTVEGDDSTAQPDAVLEALHGDWTLCKNYKLEADNAFKVRVNNAWGKNFGATGEVEPYEVTAGVATALVSGGKNLTVAAGEYDVYFNTTSLDIILVAAGSADPTIPSDAKAVKLYADVSVTDWTECSIYCYGGDLGEYTGTWPGTAMTLEDGKYVYEFAADAYGKSVNVVLNNNGKGSQTMDISNVVLDADVTIALTEVVGGKYAFTVNGVAPGLPAFPEGTTFGLIGTFNNWSAPDTDLVARGDGWYVHTGLQVAANEEILIRLNDAWDAKFGNDGSVLNIGNENILTYGGENMKIADAGTYDFYFNPSNAKLFVVVAGAADPTL